MSLKRIPGFGKSGTSRIRLARSVVCAGTAHRLASWPSEAHLHTHYFPFDTLGRLYYDTATFSPHNLRLLRDVVGADHMVMGSDYPHLLGSIERAVTSIEGMDLSGAEKERIFSGTALPIMNNLSRAS